MEQRLWQFDSSGAERGREARKERGDKEQANKETRMAVPVTACLWAPRDGMTSLVQALAARLPAGNRGKVNSPVDRVHAPRKREVGIVSRRWSRRNAPSFDSNAGDRGLTGAARGCETCWRMSTVNWRKDLQKIPYAGSAVALLGFRREQVEHRLDGFWIRGGRKVEHRQILGWQFQQREVQRGVLPDDHVLLRIFFGRSGANPTWFICPKEKTLRNIVTREIGPFAENSWRA